MNTTLFLLLAVPLILAAAVWAWRREYRDSWQIAVGVGVVGVVIMIGGFYGSRAAATDDIEIWNGQVVSKAREHGSYQRAYECNCTTEVRNSKGEVTSPRTCQTCYEDHYTVKWSCNTTVGDYTIESLDETSRRVYSTPDPRRYTTIQKGDPVAKRSHYTNYVQAVPDSLFSTVYGMKEKFEKAGLLPNYPDNVYDFYRINRFITPGWAPADAAQWNERISMALREIGPRKQVNLIIVVAKTDDPNYEYALREKWEGANKNDVVVLIGSTAYPKIDFVRVISWTKVELFKIELQDDILAKGTIDQSIVDMAIAQINKNFDRRRMREFSYLENMIEPPVWVIYTILGLNAALALFAGFFLIPRYCSNVRRWR